MNLANKITIARIFTVPVFIIFLLSDFPYGDYLTAIIFVIAASTDSMDGYIARKKNQVTNLGKFMDPLADKLLITSALIGLVEMGRISSIPAIIIISREFIITGFRTVAASEGLIIAASWWGKLKTVMQIIAIAAILLNNYPFSLIGFAFDRLALYTAVIITIFSGVDYIYKNRHLFIKK